MPQASLRDALTGVSGVMITPFIPETLEIDHIGLRHVVRLMEDAGIDVVVPCGGTGEYYALTEQERREVVETVVDEANSSPVVVGVGTGVREAIAATHHAENFGAAGIMVHQPVGVGVHPDGLVDYYRQIANSTNLSIIAYVRSSMFSPEVLAAIGRLDNVVAVKYAVEDPKSFAITMAMVEQETKLTWICGSAESWAPSFWIGGAVGFTSGIANVAPKYAIAMREALKSGAVEDIRQVWHETIAFERLRDRQSGANNVSVVKLAAEMCGLCSSAVRPPLRSPSKEDRAEIERLLKSWET